MTRLVWLAMVGLLMGAHPAWAHVTVAPRESRPGISARYTVRVPTEGKVATVEVELEIPEGVTVSPQASAGWTHTLKRTGESATSIVWTTDIKPEEFAEFGFIGRIPRPASPSCGGRTSGTPRHGKPLGRRTWYAESGSDYDARRCQPGRRRSGDRLAGTYDAAFKSKDLEKLATFYHPDVTIYEGAGINNGWADTGIVISGRS